MKYPFTCENGVWCTNYWFPAHLARPMRKDSCRGFGLRSQQQSTGTWAPTTAPRSGLPSVASGSQATKTGTRARKGKMREYSHERVKSHASPGQATSLSQGVMLGAWACTVMAKHVKSKKLACCLSPPTTVSVEQTKIQPCPQPCSRAVSPSTLP